MCAALCGQLSVQASCLYGSAPEIAPDACEIPGASRIGNQQIAGSHLNLDVAMKHFTRRWQVWSLTPALFLVFCSFAPSQHVADTARVVLIGVDGMSPDGIRNAHTPHMDSLMANGAYSFHARAVRPTSSSQNWASMIMGAAPEQHGVTSNAWERDHHSIKPTASGVGPLFPSMFDLLRQERPSAVSASIYDWGPLGRLYNQEAVSFDVDGDGPRGTTDAAVRILAEEAPTLTFVHLDHVDAAGHTHGHGTADYYASVEEADRYIGEMLAVLEAAGQRDDVTIIITSDHGGKGFGHGGDSMAELEIPWIINGPGIIAGKQIMDPITTYDTAATVAYVLGLEPPDAWIARPVYGAFEDPVRPEPIAPGPAGIDHIVVIGVDGLSPDGVQKAHTPVMTKLIEGGAYSLGARAVLTTASSQNWASMIMGASPVQHGITTNAWEPDSFSIVPTATGPEDRFPTIFSVLRAAEPDAYIASIYDWGGFGRLFPHSVVDVAIDGDGPQETTDRAREQLVEHRPRLTFVHLDHVDHALHSYGHGSDLYYASVEEADRLIGVMLSALKEAEMAERTLVIVSSDHGGRGRGHGGESMGEVEIPWIAYGPGVVAGKALSIPITTYDTAATVLFALGLPMPDAWIARPVVSAFETHHDASESSAAYVPAPRIKPLGGLKLLTEPPLITLTVDDPAAEIRYTVDGAEPDATSTLYVDAFRAPADGQLRARAFKDGAASQISQERYRSVPEGQEKYVTYAYYEGFWQMLPDFSQIEPLHSGVTYEFHLDGVENRRPNFYAVRFEGQIHLDQAGQYTFYTRSDDGTKLYIDGTEVVTNDGTHGVLEEYGHVALEAGVHTVVVEYFQDAGGAHLEVFYKEPGNDPRLMSYDEFLPR